ncbi:MAG: hypothetical protein HYS27_07730 [Deltaproteobacteria bacterium]|nr:hypothetical protein [Deltaproteobacteria bacterium]
MSSTCAPDGYAGLLRVPNTSGASLLVRAVTVSNIYAGYLEGGPDAARLRDLLAGHGSRLPVHARWDPTIDMTSTSRAIIRRVPHWMVTAQVRFDDEGEGREAYVTWLSEGVRAVSLKQLAREGLTAVDLTRAETPMPLAPASAPGLREIVTSEGVGVRAAIGWSFLAGGGAVDAGAGDAVVQAMLIGPADRARPAPPGRDGCWRTQLAWRAVVTPGAGPLDEVVRSAGRRIVWRAEATSYFDEDD